MEAEPQRANLHDVRKERERLTSSIYRESHVLRPSCDPSKASRRRYRGCGPAPDDARPSTAAAAANIRTHANPADKSVMAVQTASQQLPVKERRILEALINRFAAEEKLARLRRESEVLWIQQREFESREREMRRRREQRWLAESHRDFESSRSEARAQRALAWEREDGRKKDLVEEERERWQRSSRLQATSRAQQLEERRATLCDKKQCQEERKHGLEWKDSLHRKTLAEDMMEVELKAMRKKDAQEKRKEQQWHIKSGKERCQFSVRRAQLEKQKSLQQQQQQLKASIEQRLHQAEQLHQVQTALRNAHLGNAELRRRRHELQRQTAVRELEMDLKAWQREVENYLHECTSRGQAASERALEERRWRARTEREERVKKQMDNLQRVMEKEEMKRTRVAKEIEHKKAISESLMVKKQVALIKSREAARISAQMRDHVKELFLRKSFDKVVLEAQKYARWERRTP